jgi:hypothetical protein
VPQRDRAAPYFDGPPHRIRTPHARMDRGVVRLRTPHARMDRGVFRLRVTRKGGAPLPLRMVLIGYAPCR